MSSPRKRQVAVNRLLERAIQPAYILDADRMIVGCNDALLEWLGCTLETLLGHQCNYGTSADSSEVQRTLAGLCPPPTALEPHVTTDTPPTISESTPSTFVATRHDSTGETSFRKGQINQLRDDRSNVHWLVILDGVDHVEQPSTVANEIETLHRRVRRLRERQAGLSQVELLMGESSWTEKLCQQFKLAVDQRPRVLITGPTGTGVVDLANALHLASHPQDADLLVPLECGLLDAEILQTTIVRMKKWMLKQSRPESGWFLLLNIHELDSDAQTELLGLLELPDFEFPTIATSDLTVAELETESKINGDLLRRLSTLSIEVPPLRDRIQDIPLLAQGMVESHNASGGRQIEGFSPEAMDRLLTYQWPRNLEELREVIRESIENAKGVTIENLDLPKRLSYAEFAETYPTQKDESIDLDQLLNQIEDELIRRAIVRCDGNKTRAAELLGISRARLHRKLDSIGDSMPESKVN